MTATAQTNIFAALDVTFKGDAPINSGAVRFDSEARISLPSVAYPGRIRSQRITFADLTLDGSNRYVELKYIGSTPALDTLSVNIIGETIDLPTSMNVAYITSNVACDVTGSFPFPPTLQANKMVLIATNFNMDPVPTDEGDSILLLVWPVSGITEVGNDNFFCDIILG